MDRQALSAQRSQTPLCSSTLSFTAELSGRSSDTGGMTQQVGQRPAMAQCGVSLGGQLRSAAAEMANTSSSLYASQPR